MEYHFWRTTLIITAFSLSLALPGCGHNRVADLHPENLEDDLAIVFGTFKIFYNGKDVTENAIVSFNNNGSGGESVQIGRDGFTAVRMPSGRSSVNQISISQSSTDYTFNNLGIRAAAGGSKTYFGEVTVVIFAPPADAIDPTEKWTWQVANKWADAWRKWTRTFGDDKHKTYSSLAEKTGPDRVQTRSLATDRPQIIPSF